MFTVNRHSSREKLKEHNSESKYIHFITYFAMHEILWGQVTATKKIHGIFKL
jgi:hypothetical protein